MRKSVLMLATVAILTIAVSGCAAQDVRHVPVALPKPIKPVLPAIKAEAVACLSNAAYADIVERDRLRKNYAEECIAIIDANNAGIKKGSE